ncbi:MAG: beta-L-arabinofuranosidase domain-containing protein [Pirellulaceae bacterium]
MLMMIGTILASVAVCANGEVDVQGRRLLEPLNYQGVTLTQGTLARQFGEVCEYYLRIPNDDLLKPYRQRAGKDARGADMGGCYVGHNPFGQFLSGLSRMYAATGDTVYRDKAIVLMEGWAECIEPDGFFFAENNPQLIPYYYEKMVGGLVDICAYCDEPRALEHLSRITDWAEQHISRVRLYANPVTNDGGEWYTLSENLYRAYMLSGDKRYADFARVWEYRDYWDFFAEGKGTEIFTRPGWYHAYSHVNTFCGLGAAYLAEGDSYHLTALVNAYDYLQEHQCWATGGYGPNESLLPRDQLIAMLGDAQNHFETQCGSWAGFKMTKYLISLTGDARYGDWTEKLLLNGIGASIPMSGDGKPFYYSEYNTGGSQKRNINAQWPCCSGTRPEAVADYHDLLYFQDSGGIYVSQFASSTVEFEVKGSAVRMIQQTRFPEEDTVRFAVHIAAPLEFDIAIRVPGWLAGPMAARVNGIEQTVTAAANHWAMFRRTWSQGDILEIKLPMDLWVSRMDKDCDFPAAIMFGPVALAVRPVDANPADKIDFAQIRTAFTLSTGDPLTWKLASDPSVLLRPFYVFKEGERYLVYLDPAQDLTYRTYRAATYEGAWNDFGGWMTSSVPGSSTEVSFTGKGIRVHYFTYDDAGRFDVAIDDKIVGVLDIYGPKRGEAASADYVGLPDGRHTLRLTLLPEKSPQSKGTFVNVSAFESLK